MVCRKVPQLDGFPTGPKVSFSPVLIVRENVLIRKIAFLCSTLLKGVPSNAQLALTLLRIGEDHHTPLPPPPQYTEAPPERSLTPELEDNLPPVNEDFAERDLSHDHEFHDDDATEVGEDDAVTQETTGASDHKQGKKHRFLGFLKGTAKAGVTATLGADRVKASVGSSKSKQRQGVLRRRQYQDGPSMFKCRYEGKKGWLLIVSGVSRTLSRSARRVVAD